jgi:hypothetical protein
MPLLKPRKRNRWLSGEKACELLGIEGTGKTKAKSRLAANAERWGIRKIRLGNNARGTVVYPEIDLYEYMDRKEQEAAVKVKPTPRAKASTDPSFLKMRAQKKWLSARAVAYLLSLVSVQAGDTPEQIKAAERKAIQMLNEYAPFWGIRRIDHQGGVRKRFVSYPEEDVLAYMERKDEEAQELTKYMRYRPTYFPAVIGPGLSKWWGIRNSKLSCSWAGRRDIRASLALASSRSRCFLTTPCLL